jgi:hypothetical protein
MGNVSSWGWLATLVVARIVASRLMVPMIVLSMLVMPMLVAMSEPSLSVVRTIIDGTCSLRWYVPRRVVLRPAHLRLNLLWPYRQVSNGATQRLLLFSMTPLEHDFRGWLQ